MICTGDTCPICKQNQMPPWTGAEEARCCQKCGYIQERQDTTKEK